MGENNDIIIINSSNLDFYLRQLENIAVLALESLKGNYSEKQLDILKRFNSIYQFIKDLSNKHKFIGIKAKDNKMLIGFLQYLEFPKYVKIIKIFVHPKEQRKNYGSKLISVIKSLNKPIIVEAALTTQAINFYKKNGFKKIALREKLLRNVSFKVLAMLYKPQNY